MHLEPLPETHDALHTMTRWSDRDFMTELRQLGERAQDVVPNLVGLSLALARGGLTFTLAATPHHLAILDAVQYALGGPCVDAVTQDALTLSGDSDAGLLDETRWVQFARASAAHGVLSTLSMPIHDEDRVAGGVNLYAATPNAFAGRHEQLADIFGGWAPGAVTNADLSFSTRAAAEKAPQALEDLHVLDQATGVIAAAHGVDAGTARQLIADAAHQAGQDELEVARALIRPFLGSEEE